MTNRRDFLQMLGLGAFAAAVHNVDRVSKLVLPDQELVHLDMESPDGIVWTTAQFDVPVDIKAGDSLKIKYSVGDKSRMQIEHNNSIVFEGDSPLIDIGQSFGQVAEAAGNAGESLRKFGDAAVDVGDSIGGLIQQFCNAHNASPDVERRIAQKYLRRWS